MLRERADHYINMDRPRPTSPGASSTFVLPEFSPAPADLIGLGDLTAALWYRKVMIASAAIFGLIIGLMVGLFSTSTYRAHTSLQLEGFDDQFLHETTPISPLLPNATAENYLQNQVKLLQSETLARRVANKLRPQPQETSLGFIAQLHIPFSFSRSRRMTPEERRIKRVQEALTVRTSLQSQVIDLFYDAPDPGLAAFGANAAASEFIDLNREARWQLAQDTTDWLNKQAADLKAKLETSNRELQDFARSSGLVFAGKQETLAEDRMRQLQDSLAKAEADRAAKQSRYEAAINNSGDLMSDAVATGPMRQYQLDLQNMRRELAQLRTLYQPTHYKVVRLEAQIADTEKAIEKERSEIVGRLRTEQVAAAGLERTLSSSQANQLKTVEQQMEKERHYGVLKSEIDTTQRLYEAMLQKVKEAGAASSMRSTNIRVIDPATIPSIPYSPNMPLNMAIGFGMGAVGGVGLAFVRERTDKMRRPGEAALAPELPELGAIPAAPVRRFLRPADTGPLDRITWEQKDSAMSESFRAVMASLLSPARNGEAPGMFVVTSPLPGEGKTTVTSNLAIALAEIKHRVLLIDGDLRRPRVHKIFGLSNSWGLTDLQNEMDSGLKLPIDQIVKPTSVPNLYVLPSGPTAPDGISQLLYSQRTLRLVDRFREEFDYVLVDAPPCLEFADARILARNATGVILVLRANQTDKRMAMAAAGQLIQDGIPVIGTILNDWDPKSTARYGYGKYGQSYYTRASIRPESGA